MDFSNFFPTSRTPVPLSGPGTAITPTGGGLPAVPGRSLVPSGPNIIDGEWSEVPKLLSGGSKALTSRAASAIAKLMGGVGSGSILDAMLGPMGAVIAAGDGRPDNSPSDLQGLTAAYAAARAQHPAVPAGQVQSAPLQPPDMGVHPPNSWDEDAPKPAPQPPQQAAPPGNNIPWWANAQGANFGRSPVPMPQARPAQAPQPQPQAQPQPQPQASPMMNFFQRNTALMKDPSTGAYIDPQAAAKALAQMNSQS